MSDTPAPACLKASLSLLAGCSHGPGVGRIAKANFSGDVRGVETSSPLIGIPIVQISSTQNGQGGMGVRLRHDGLAFRTISRVQSSHLMPQRLRRALLRAAGVKLGENVRIWPGVAFYGANLSIGSHSFINSGVIVDAVEHVAIGSRVRIGFNVKLITSSHYIAGPEDRAGWLRYQPIAIDDGTWVGAGAIILPGVRIGRGCVVGAGAVVTRDAEPNGLYAGVPARRLRAL